MKNFIVNNDLSATILVPWNCKYHCDFCSMKKLYEKYTEDPEIELINIINTIKHFNNTSISKYIISGGEPFENLEGLKKIIEAIDSSKKIYIETSLPLNVAYIDYINNEHRISGINISRNSVTDMFERGGSTLDLFLSKFRKSVNIKISYVCKSNNDFIIDNLQEYLDRFIDLDFCDNLSIDFVKNKNLVTSAEDLIGIKDPLLERLLEVCRYKENKITRVSSKDIFEYKGFEVSYVRSLINTSYSINNNVKVNEIVIFPDGSWGYDWNKKEEEKDKLFRKLLANKLMAEKSSVIEYNILEDEENRRKQERDSLWNYAYYRDRNLNSSGTPWEYYDSAFLNSSNYGYASPEQIREMQRLLSNNIFQNQNSTICEEIIDKNKEKA